jgi:hypothetical protein
MKTSAKTRRKTSAPKCVNHPRRKAVLTARKVPLCRECAVKAFEKWNAKKDQMTEARLDNHYRFLKGPVMRIMRKLSPYVDASRVFKSLE